MWNSSFAIFGNLTLKNVVMVIKYCHILSTHINGIPSIVLLSYHLIPPPHPFHIPYFHDFSFWVYFICRLFWGYIRSIHPTTPWLHLPHVPSTSYLRVISLFAPFLLLIDQLNYEDHPPNTIHIIFLYLLKLSCLQNRLKRRWDGGCFPSYLMWIRCGMFAGGVIWRRWRGWWRKRELEWNILRKDMFDELWERCDFEFIEQQNSHSHGCLQRLFGDCEVFEE